MCVLFNYKTNNWNASKINILIRIKLYIRYLLTHTYIIVLTRKVEFYYIV